MTDTTSGPAVICCDPDLFESAIPDLSDILTACVEGGASVGFLLPVNREDIVMFWERQAPAVAAGGRQILLARSADGRIVGTVTLILDQPANGRHRAEIAKLLVHPDARRQGIAVALMQAAEKLAWHAGRSLLVLDTLTGDAGEQLYPRLGFELAGYIPDYARLNDGRLASTSLFFKRLVRPD